MAQEKRRNIYLDNAAATPMDSRVIEAMVPYFSDKFYNPSSVYLAAKGAKKDLDEMRHNLAHWLGAKASEIYFVAGATEADNLAISGVMDAIGDGNIIVSSIEHDAVIRAAQEYECRFASVDRFGMLKLEELKKQIDDETNLVSVMYANNEVGTVQSISSVAEIIEGVRKDRKKRGVARPIYLHSDAVQAINYLDLHVNKIKVDLMSLSSGKCYGPKQIGALYIRAGVVGLKSRIVGGGQERGLRSGTENLAQIAGFVKAVDIAQKMRKDEGNRLGLLRKKLIKGLESLHDDLEIVGSKKHTLPNIVSFMISGMDGERVVMALDEMGIMCATGSACSALSDESSHVIKALGCNELEASGTIRLSMGRQTTEEDIDETLERIKEVLKSKYIWK